MRSLLTGSNANLSWSKMFVEKDPEVILQKDHPYLIFDTEQHTLAYSEAGSSSSTIFAKFDNGDLSKWLSASLQQRRIFFSADFDRCSLSFGILFAVLLL